MSKDYIEDEELILLVNEDVEEAKNKLFEKYYYIIPYYLKKYSGIIKALEINKKDLIEEAIVTLVKAIELYNEIKPASLKTYLRLCVERKIRRRIESENGEKSKFEKSILSLDLDDYQSYNIIVDSMSDKNDNNPELLLSTDEEYNKLLKKINALLSDFEKKVFFYLIDDYDYKTISKILNKSPKSIDNTIQRIKNKLKILL